jgi:hypothetical protein
MAVEVGNFLEWLREMSGDARPLATGSESPPAL